MAIIDVEAKWNVKEPGIIKVEVFSDKKNAICYDIYYSDKIYNRIMNIVNLEKRSYETLKSWKFNYGFEFTGWLQMCKNKERSFNILLNINKDYELCRLFLRGIGEPLKYRIEEDP